MKKLLTILFAFALGLNLIAQSDTWDPDWDGDGNVGVSDLLALLSVFSENDADGDGIWDSVDDCVGVYDACGVCGGTGEDVDNDGLCDDVDDYVWARTTNAACAMAQARVFLSSMRSCTPRIRYSLIRLTSGTCSSLRRIPCSHMCAL